MSDSLQTHYESTFKENAGELYAPLSPMDLAAHHRRIEILNSLPLSDLSKATVVDYGVGSWGFGCIFERLKECANPIGIDISQKAIEESAARSRGDALLAGKEVRYLTSLGYKIGLDSASVDLVFCGECIEHVEDTRAFLTEIHRIIKPGGLAIFTTPNASPWVYRQLGFRWCVGFEHVALMDYDEFEYHLSQYFEVECIHGFNQSIHRDLDMFVPEALREKWVRVGYRDPRNATSLIAVVRKPAAAFPFTPQRVRSVEWGETRISGPVTKLDLVRGVCGGMIEKGSSFEIDVPPGLSRCNLIFWSHDWSGIAEIVTDAKTYKVDLYSPVGGCTRVTLTDLHGGSILINPIGTKSSPSIAAQVILYRAVFAGDV